MPDASSGRQRGYRAEATRALWEVVGISSLVVSAGFVAAWAGSRPLRQLAATMTHACVQLWAILPVILQWMLSLSAVVVLLSAVLWLTSLGRQWRTTGRSIATLRRRTVQLPNRLRSLAARLSLAGRLIAVEDPRPVALTVGLIAPRIIVSSGLISALDDEELEAVVLHEQSHLEHRDPLRLLAARALAAAVFYVPAARALARRHEAAVELAADEYTIVRQGHALALSSAMLRVLEAAPSPAGANPFTGSLDLRLSYLLAERTHLPVVSRRAALQSLAAAAVLFLPAFATSALAAALSHASFLFRCPV